MARFLEEEEQEIARFLSDKDRETLEQLKTSLIKNPDK